MEFKDLIRQCLIFLFGHISQPQKLESRLRSDVLVRCTRRFTPGMCLESVETVWSFVFQIQNCTEHLGCPPDRRTNRFQTFKRCIRRCKPLINIYTAILGGDLYNMSDFYLRSKTWGTSIRREMESEHENDSDMFEDYEENIKEPLVNGPPISMEDFDQDDQKFPPDIDYIETEHNKDDLIDHEALLE